MNTKQIIEDIRQACDERGLKLTDLRREVLELVLQSTKPVKAYDLLEQLKQDRRKAAPPTVYRALDFLLENHFIHRIESLNAFVSCFHPDHQHQSQFLICENCENVQELSNSSVGDTLSTISRQQNFEPTRQVIEVYGTCADCR